MSKGLGFYTHTIDLIILPWGVSRYHFGSMEMNFSHSEVYFTVKDLWSPMGVLQRGQKVKLM